MIILDNSTLKMPNNWQFQLAVFSEKLNSGEPVILADDRVIKPADVMTSPIPADVAGGGRQNY
jgi:hypothetical protein